MTGCTCRAETVLQYGSQPFSLDFMIFPLVFILFSLAMAVLPLGLAVFCGRIRVGAGNVHLSKSVPNFLFQDFSYFGHYFLIFCHW